MDWIRWRLRRWIEPIPCSHESRWEFGLRVVGLWIVMAILIDSLGFPVVAGAIIAMPFLFVYALIHGVVLYGPTAVSAANIAEWAGLYNPPDWFAIVKIVSAPIGVFQSLIGLEHFREIAVNGVKRIDWSRVGSAVLSVGSWVIQFVRQRSNR